MSYEVGQSVHLRSDFKNKVGQSADPDTAVVEVLDPAGTITTPTVINDPDVVGGFDAFVTATLPGKWSYRWIGTGDVDASGTKSFWVSRSVFDVQTPFTATSPICSLWASLDDLANGCNVPDDLNEDRLEVALQMASEMLFRWSGNRWPGTCEEVDWRPPFEAYCGGTHGYQIRVGPPRIDLWKATKGLPVLSGPESVTIDGAELDAATYRVDAKRWLTRLRPAGGPNPGWPRRQHLDRATTDEGTTLISGITYGAEPEVGGKHTAVVLACEIAKSMSAETKVQESCQLPRRVQNVTRDGITIGAVVDPMDYLAEGRTGIYFVDLWLSSVNPNKLQHRAVIVNPDDFDPGLVV